MDKIDFVLIWVDGGDPEWQKQKNRFLGKPQGTNTDAGENRYRDWDNLKYWFRGVEKFAPWVNQIHFVTCGHVPEWLNLNAPKLHFVKHSDYIPEEYLPTFSANPIELNLHRIPGLAEQFVFFNDDLFLTAPTQPTDFFRNGLPCDAIAEQVYGFASFEAYSNIRINNLIFCNRHFKRKKCIRKLWKKWFSLQANFHDCLRNLYYAVNSCPYFFGLDVHHLPQAFRRDTLETVWELEPEWLDETCRRKFRDGRDLNQYIFKSWQLLTGNFAPCDKKKQGKYFSLGKNLNGACRAISEGRYKTVCLNDADVAAFEESKAAVCQAFEKLLPEKSSFEL